MAYYGSWIFISYFTSIIYGNNIAENTYKKENAFNDLSCNEGILDVQSFRWSKFRCASYCSSQIHCLSFFYNSDGVCQLHKIILYLPSNCLNLPKTTYYINRVYSLNRASEFSTQQLNETTQHMYTDTEQSTQDLKSSTDKTTQTITISETTTRQLYSKTESTTKQIYSTTELTSQDLYTTIEQTTQHTEIPTTSTTQELSTVIIQTDSTPQQLIQTTKPTTQHMYGTTESTTQVECDPEWLQLGAGCYQFTPPDSTRLIWTDAKIICDQQGGYLTVIESTEENEALKEYIAVFGSVDLWMGGTDFATEGTFIWNHTNTIVDLPDTGRFHDWYPPNQPDNGNGGTEQHCMAFYGRGDYKWNDVNCAVTRRFVCEKDPS